MKYFLAFKYTNVFSRELDGTGVNVTDEIVSEIIERASARILAESSLQVRNIIGLFSHRGKPIGEAYINRSLIPMLCRKVGGQESDALGRITCHRARSTTASQLYNAKEPMSLH